MLAPIIYKVKYYQPINWKHQTSNSKATIEVQSHDFSLKEWE
jgi:hypothetical protein